MRFYTVWAEGRLSIRQKYHNYQWLLGGNFEWLV